MTATVGRPTTTFERIRRTYFVAITFMLAGSFCLAGADSRGDEPGTRRSLTVVTHGCQISPLPSVPLWARNTAVALRERGVTECVVVDWAAESNDAAAGWAESAGDVLFARIMREVINADGSIDLHLIGHSRGAVENSEAQRRLAWLMEQRPEIARKIGRIQVTMLDPHPANGRAGFWTNSPLYEKSIRLFEERAMDPDPVVWSNTTLVDVYIQKCEIAPSDKPFLNPFGMQLDRAGVDNLVDLTGREFVRRGPD